MSASTGCTLGSSIMNDLSCSCYIYDHRKVGHTISTHAKSLKPVRDFKSCIFPFLNLYGDHAAVRLILTLLRSLRCITLFFFFNLCFPAFQKQQVVIKNQNSTKVLQPQCSASLLSAPQALLCTAEPPPLWPEVDKSNLMAIAQKKRFINAHLKRSSPAEAEGCFFFLKLRQRNPPSLPSLPPTLSIHPSRSPARQLRGPGECPAGER